MPPLPAPPGDALRPRNLVCVEVDPIQVGMVAEVVPIGRRNIRELLYGPGSKTID